MRRLEPALNQGCGRWHQLLPGTRLGAVTVLVSAASLQQGDGVELGFLEQ